MPDRGPSKHLPSAKDATEVSAELEYQRGVGINYNAEPAERLTDGWVSFHVDSLDETARFYEDAFGCTPVPAADVGSIVLRLGSNTLQFTDALIIKQLLIDNVEAPLTALPQGCELTLVIDAGQLAPTVERAVKAGALLMQAPTVLAGDAIAFLRDPNGFLIRLLETDAP